MRKKRDFLKLSRWMMLLLLGAAFWVSGKEPKEAEQLNFFQVGKEVIKDSFTKQMVYSQSMIPGFLLEQENAFWKQNMVIKVESRVPFEEKEYVLAMGEELMNGFMEENNIAVGKTKEEFYLHEPGDFVPQTQKQAEINIKDYLQIDDAIKRFYTVDSTTEVDSSFFNIEEMRKKDCSIDKNMEKPGILIYHTHSEEAFADSEPGKEEDTIVGAGEILAGYLEQYGFKVLHHKGKYDVKSRDYAYSNALPELEKLLQDNPEIQVVIDLHRDAVAEGTKLVTEIQGKQVAKVMFFNGLGRIKNKGEISYLKNPYLQENLAFSFQMKVACDEYYPGFARKNYLRAYRYNMHLCPKTLLIELGAQTNTKEEIHGALEPLAHVLSMVLSGENQIK